MVFLRLVIAISRKYSFTSKPLYLNHPNKVNYTGQIEVPIPPISKRNTSLLSSMESNLKPNKDNSTQFNSSYQNDSSKPTENKYLGAFTKVGLLLATPKVSPSDIKNTGNNLRKGVIFGAVKHLLGKSRLGERIFYYRSI